MLLVVGVLTGAQPVLCDKACHREEAVEHLAVLSGEGDLDAMRASYELERTKYPSLAMDWALRLAVQGDAEFQRLHFETFIKNVSPSQQATTIEKYRKIAVGPKTDCYLKVLASKMFSEECAIQNLP